MSLLPRAATFAFSLLLHGSIVAAGFLIANAEAVPEEKIYRVSLAEFAPAQASVIPREEEKATPAPAEHQPETPIEPVEQPEVVPPPPKPAPVVTPKPTPARPVPQPQRRREQTRPQHTENKTEQTAVPEPQPAAPSHPPEGTGGTARGGPRTIGGLSAYVEDAVDQRPSISRRVMPEYPDRARRMNMQGQVVVQLVVDASGNPQQCVIYSSEPAGVFDEAALAAARRTRFLPGKVGGQPVNTIVLIPYKFTLR